MNWRRFERGQSLLSRDAAAVLRRRRRRGWRRRGRRQFRRQHDHQQDGHFRLGDAGRDEADGRPQPQDRERPQEWPLPGRRVHRTRTRGRRLCAGQYVAGCLSPDVPRSGRTGKRHLCRRNRDPRLHRLPVQAPDPGQPGDRHDGLTSSMAPASRRVRSIAPKSNSLPTRAKSFHASSRCACR